MKGANRYMKILLVVFEKKKSFFVIYLLAPFIVPNFKKNQFNLLALGHFLLFDWAWPKLSQATVNWILK